MKVDKSLMLCMCVMAAAASVTSYARVKVQHHIITLPVKAELSERKQSDKVFDDYGDLPFEKEKEHLDEFALRLQELPDARGYIIAYAGRRACVREARTRANRARKYLVKNRGIGVKRIVALDGGYRENFTITLYIVLHDTKAPVPIPTVDPKEVELVGCNR